MPQRLWALAVLPVAALSECQPQCAPAAAPSEPVAVAAVAWTVDWDAVAWCESGGNWSHGPVTNSSGTYSGGLMIGHRWWAPNGGNEFASAPYLATKEQQIVVAENIVDAHGGGTRGADIGWQCYP